MSLLFCLKNIEMTIDIQTDINNFPTKDYCIFKLYMIVFRHTISSN